MSNDAGKIESATADVEAIMKSMGIDPGSAKAKDLLKAMKADSKSRRTTPAEIEAKYGHVVKGTVRFDATANKQKATITCTVGDCKKQRDVFTSDLFQVNSCVDCKDKARKAKRDEQKALLEDFKKRKQAAASTPEPKAEAGEEIEEDAPVAE